MAIGKLDNAVIYIEGLTRTYSHSSQTTSKKRFSVTIKFIIQSWESNVNSSDKPLERELFMSEMNLTRRRRNETAVSVSPMHMRKLWQLYAGCLQMFSVCVNFLIVI